jgi:hypothetical protein
MCAPMYSAEPPRAGRPGLTAMTWTGWSIGVVMATPLEHRCRCGPAADASRRGAVRLWGLLLHERRSTGAVRAPVAGRMLFSMRKPCPDGCRLRPDGTLGRIEPAQCSIGPVASRRTPSRTPLCCASRVPHVPRPPPLGHRGPRLTPPTAARASRHQPRPAPHATNRGPRLTPSTTARASPTHSV